MAISYDEWVKKQRQKNNGSDIMTSMGGADVTRTSYLNAVENMSNTESNIASGNSGNSKSSTAETISNEVNPTPMTGVDSKEKNGVTTSTTYKPYEEYSKESEYLKRAQALADKERNQAIIDADTSYQKALSGYGRNAELLAKMGLSGSGYSDYLNAQAYAQKQGAISEANEQHADAMSDAKYQDYINYQSEKTMYEGNYSEYIEKALSGNYTKDEMRALLQNSGMSEADVETIVSQAENGLDSKTKNTVDVLKEEIYTNGRDSEWLDMILSTNEYSHLKGTEYETELRTYVEKNNQSQIEKLYDTLNYEIITNGVTEDELNKLLGLTEYSKLIGSEYEKRLRNAAQENSSKYNENISTEIEAAISAGEYRYDNAGAAMLISALSKTNLDDTTKEQIKRSYVEKSIKDIKDGINTSTYIDEFYYEQIASIIKSNKLFSEEDKKEVYSALLSKSIEEKIITNGKNVAYESYKEISEDLTAEDREHFDALFDDVVIAEKDNEVFETNKGTFGEIVRNSLGKDGNVKEMEAALSNVEKNLFFDSNKKIFNDMLNELKECSTKKKVYLVLKKYSEDSSWATIPDRKYSVEKQLGDIAKMILNSNRGFL